MFHFRKTSFGQVWNYSHVWKYGLDGPTSFTTPSKEASKPANQPRRREVDSHGVYAVELGSQGVWHTRQPRPVRRIRAPGRAYVASTRKVADALIPAHPRDPRGSTPLQRAETAWLPQQSTQSLSGRNHNPMFSLQEAYGLLSHVSAAERSCGGISLGFHERATDVHLPP